MHIIYYDIDWRIYRWKDKNISIKYNYTGLHILFIYICVVLLPKDMSSDDTLEISISSWFLGSIVLIIGVIVPLVIIIGKNKKVFKSCFKLCNRNQKQNYLAQ